MIWSVALFGHEKPRVTGWEFRAKPGDIIACKPADKAHTWTSTERAEFLIIEIDGFEPDDIAALTEPLWDTNSIPVLPDKMLEELIAKGETVQLLPTRHLNKRRFNIPIADLQAAGVDTARMLDKEQEYAPEVKTFAKVEVFDKLNSTRVSADAGMNLITPLTVGRPF